MPLYQHRCEDCGHEVEYLVRRSDPEEPLPLCAECEGTMQLCMPRPSFRLKGRGWAKDGYSDG